MYLKIVLKIVYIVIEKIREMSFGLPNMSEMLKYADIEVKDSVNDANASQYLFALHMQTDFHLHP